MSQRVLPVLWDLLNTLSSVSFVLAICAGLLALAWGKAGLKKLKPKQEAALWRWTAALALIKVAALALTLPVELYQYFKR